MFKAFRGLAGTLANQSYHTWGKGKEGIKNDGGEEERSEREGILKEGAGLWMPLFPSFPPLGAERDGKGGSQRPAVGPELNCYATFAL